MSDEGVKRTSDGITREDWESVTDLATDIGNSSTPTQRALALAHLLRFLDTLEAKYGLCPSILATRADFIDDARAKESLFKDAYLLAEPRDDKVLTLDIAHSLASLYIDDIGDVTRGDEWLRRLKMHLDETPDDLYAADYERWRLKTGHRPDISSTR
jgi:hypothetical protein